MIRHVIGGEYVARVDGRVIQVKQARAAYAVLERVKHENSYQHSHDIGGDGRTHIRRSAGQRFDVAG